MARENLERNFGFLLNDVARLLRTRFDRQTKTLGLTRSQAWVVTHLYRQDGQTQSELAELLEIEKPTLGRLLDRLEEKHWIRRESDEIDRRAKRVYLTNAAGPEMKALRQIAASVRREALAGIDKEEQERFVDALINIKQNLVKIAADENGHNGPDGQENGKS